MAASPTHGAVFRAQGSVTIHGSSSRLRRTGTWPSPATMSARSLGMSGLSRESVSSMSVRRVPMARNCFGRSLRDSGQKRVPEPPAMMTA